jgi:para-nitrobenzyl esterase
MTLPVVRTRYGEVRGVASAGVNRFLGVPYAAAPVGRRRLNLPEPPPAWNGVRDATVPGANAPQIIRAFPGLDVSPLVGTGWQPGDDFLTANLFAPEGAARLPVLLFIHGGAFVGGCSDAPVHAGQSFARAGIVYVAINYRLGIEGFLPIPGVPTNLGLRDQIAALHWLKDNIESFGGDPHNITLAGESAGGMSVANLMSSPLARGLFRRAIVQSGHGSMVRSMSVAQRMVQSVARHLNIESAAEAFRHCSLSQSAAAVEAVTRPEAPVDLREASGFDPAFGLSRFLPVYGDEVMPEHPLDALHKGACADVDLLIGTTREEMNIYLVPTGVRRAINAAQATAMLAASAPSSTDILAAYDFNPKDPGDALTRSLTDLVFRLPARRFASAHQGRTYLYEFGWRSPACDGALGACHALELPFVFNTLGSCTGADGVVGTDPPQRLADAIHAKWVNFVTHGECGWDAFEAESRLCHRLDTGSTERDAPIPAAAFA